MVIPALDEERSVGQVVQEVRAAGFPALVIDDGSVDRTAEVAENAGATVLRLPVNLGVGGALRCAFRYAVTQGYDVVVQCDADGQHDPAQIATLLDTMRDTGADLVIGSRFASRESSYAIGRVRRFMMGRLARMASRRTGATITDATSGFRAIRGNLLGGFAATYPAEYLGDTVESLAARVATASRSPRFPPRCGHARSACRARRRSRRPGTSCGSSPRCGSRASGPPVVESCTSRSGSVTPRRSTERDHDARSRSRFSTRASRSSSSAFASLSSRSASR